jgi:hypothetical protein
VKEREETEKLEPHQANSQKTAEKVGLNIFKIREIERPMQSTY